MLLPFITSGFPWLLATYLLYLSSPQNAAASNRHHQVERDLLSWQYWLQVEFRSPCSAVMIRPLHVVTIMLHCAHDMETPEADHKLIAKDSSRSKGPPESYQCAIVAPNDHVHNIIN
jgi:hypothetical protein